MTGLHNIVMRQLIRHIAASPRLLRLAKIVLALVTFLAWLPFLAIAASFVTMVVTGCQVDGVRDHPCVVAGHDIGDALGTCLLILPFLAGPFLPFAIGTVVAWVILWRRASQFRKLV